MSLSKIWNKYVASGWRNDDENELYNQMDGENKNIKLENQQEMAKNLCKSNISRLSKEIEDYSQKITSIGIDSYNKEGYNLDYLMTQRSMLMKQKEIYIKNLENLTIEETERIQTKHNMDLIKKLKQNQVMVNKLKNQYTPVQLKNTIEKLMVERKYNSQNNQMIQSLMDNLSLQNQIDPEEKERQKEEIYQNIANAIHLEWTTLWPRPQAMLLQNININNEVNNRLLTIQSNRDTSAPYSSSTSTNTPPDTDNDKDKLM